MGDEDMEQTVTQSSGEVLAIAGQVEHCLTISGPIGTRQALHPTQCAVPRTRSAS
jgi:hypothetical protein